MYRNLKTFDFEPVTFDKSSWEIERHTKTASFFDIKLNGDTPLEMIEIPGGSFTMGSLPDEADNRENERPDHQVDVSSFFMGKYPVTQSQWVAVTGNLPKMDEEFYGRNLPVVNVWLELALEFCKKLSQITNLPFRIPTEAEWEYACRAGTKTPFSCGETIITDIANFNGNKPYNNSSFGIFRQKTTPVGYFQTANPFGLYDMHGNVWEWCADIWHEDYNGAPIDGSAWLANGDHSYCVQRGGSWNDRAGACRSAFRVGDVAHNNDNIVGLRVCI